MKYYYKIKFLCQKFIYTCISSFRLIRRKRNTEMEISVTFSGGKKSPTPTILKKSLKIRKSKILEKKLVLKQGIFFGKNHTKIRKRKKKFSYLLFR